MKDELHKNIAEYVNQVGADVATDIAAKSIQGLLFDSGNTAVGLDNLLLAMIKFQVEVMIYLKADRERVDELVLEFSKEILG